jgi:hypothetical protein
MRSLSNRSVRGVRANTLALANFCELGLFSTEEVYRSYPEGRLLMMPRGSSPVGCLDGQKRSLTVRNKQTHVRSTHLLVTTGLKKAIGFLPLQHDNEKEQGRKCSLRYPPAHHLHTR